MKKLFAPVIILIFAVSAAFAQPKLEIVGGTTQDWGDVKSYESPLKSDITLKNAGDAKLVIEQVKPTCGCTTAPLDKSELNPGESTVMHVTLNLGRTTGPMSKGITIRSNDPERSTQIVRLKANVINPIDITPKAYITFDKMQVGREKTVELKIINRSEKPVKLTEISYSPSDLVVNLQGGVTLKPNQEIPLIVKATPAKTGYYSCKIKIKTTHPEIPELSIPGYGNVQESPIFNN